MRHGPTDAERLLWQYLRHLSVAGSHFRRQATIGPYFADFACHAPRMVIELDGGQHNEASGLTRDAKRTADLQARGYRVLRFWNNDVLGNVEGVMETIAAAVRETSPPPPTPPRHASHGGRGVESATFRQRERQGTVSYSPPHASEASGGEGSGVGGGSRAGAENL